MVAVPVSPTGALGRRATSMAEALVSTTQSARGQMAYIPRAPAPAAVAAGVAAEGVGRALTF